MSLPRMEYNLKEQKAQVKKLKNIMRNLRKRKTAWRKL